MERRRASLAPALVRLPGANLTFLEEGCCCSWSEFELGLDFFIMDDVRGGDGDDVGAVADEDGVDDEV